VRVGYVGLGAMGGALARHLPGKYPFSVFDINKAAVAPFRELGAFAASSPAQLAARSDVVLLCLPRSSNVEQAIFGPDGLSEQLAPGSIVIDQTSGVPGETRKFANRLAGMGVSMFDAPVSGPMQSAIAGTISIIASGPRDVFEKALPVLRTISQNVFHCGERVGNGQTMKSVNNMMNVGCRLSTLEVVAMGRKQGLTLPVMIEALNATTARNHTTRGLLPALLEGRQTVQFFLALQVKDMNQALAMGVDEGVPAPIGSVCRGLLQIGLNALGDDAQLEEIVGVIESMAGTRLVESASSASKSVQS
jgi:3-hydroxyisobutyrate dehydrogenase